MQKFKTVLPLMFFLGQMLLALDAPGVKLHDPKLKPLKLSTMKIDATILSDIATSTYELIFYNPNDRIIEGELVFSLLDGQSVVDYALEIDGKYRSASVVPKAKAKEAYEDMVRQNIDPGMIEKSIGNNFKTRLYPIPAKGYKKIKITIRETLSADKGIVRYHVPFLCKESLDNFVLNIDVLSMKKSKIKVDGIEFDESREGNRYTLKKSNFVLMKPITMEFDRSGYEEKFVQQKGGKYFFYATMNYQPEVTARRLPRRTAILYDTSLSNRERDSVKEFEFLRKYISQSGSKENEVIFFDNAIGKKIRFTTVEELEKLLQDVHYNGTNDFGRIDISKIDADVILLFSNGMKTIHQGDPIEIDKPLIAVNASLRSDSGVLRKYAGISGGAYIDLIQKNTDEAMQLLNESIPIISITATGGIKPEETVTAYANGRITIFASSNTPKASLQLEIRDGEKSITRSIDFSDAMVLQDHIASIWASHYIDQLSYEYDSNSEKINALAKEYKILTRDMSMIVLDRVEDYVKHEITPPDELSEEYGKLLAEKKNEKLYEKEQALIEAIELIEEQKQWYNKKFPKTKKIIEKDDNTNEADGEGGDIAPVVEAPMMDAAPSPSMEERSRSRAEDREVETLKKKAVNSESTGETKELGIKLKEFDPDTPYLKTLRSVSAPKLMERYYALQQEYIEQPMFYVDSASHLYKNGLKVEAMRILENLLELDLDNSEFLRIFAFKAMEFGEYDSAVKALERVKKLRPFEPQSFRDLALGYSKAGEYQKALDNLYHIVIHTWDGRFNGIKIVVLNELNNIISRQKVDSNSIDKRLIASMPVDLRVVINWSGNDSDMDLWVTDPYGEKTYYSNKLSHIGGKISNDITGGYGPEEFMIRDAVKGSYIIEVNYFGSSEQKPTIPVTIRGEIYTHYGKKEQKSREIVVRVGNQSRVEKIGEFIYE